MPIFIVPTLSQHLYARKQFQIPMSHPCIPLFLEKHFQQSLCSSQHGMFHYSSSRNVVINCSVYYFTDARSPQMSTVLIGFAGFTRQRWLPPTLKTCSHLRLWLGQVRRVVRKFLHVLGAAETFWQASHPSTQRWNVSGLMCMVPGAFHRWVCCHWLQSLGSRPLQLPVWCALFLSLYNLNVRTNSGCHPL